MENTHAKVKVTVSTLLPAQSPPDNSLHFVLEATDLERLSCLCQFFPQKSLFSCEHSTNTPFNYRWRTKDGGLRSTTAVYCLKTLPFRHTRLHSTARLPVLIHADRGGVGVLNLRPAAVLWKDLMHKL